jgi:hypothetical protein
MGCDSEAHFLIGTVDFAMNQMVDILGSNEHKISRTIPSQLNLLLFTHPSYLQSAYFKPISEA